MKKRILYIDVLRVMAIFAVIMIHVSAEHWYTNTIDMKWCMNNIVNTLVSVWAVPLFVAISGAMQLDNENFTIKKMFTKYIPRILITLVAWHIIYYFYDHPVFNIQNVITCMKNLLLGRTYSHLWFLYLLLGLYLLTPILNKLVKNLTQKELIYVLCLGFFLTSVIPTASILLDMNLTKLVEPYHLFTTPIFPFYYMLGYYLKKYDIPKPALLLAISIISLLGFSIASYYHSIHLKEAFSYVNTKSIFSITMIISLFSICKLKFKNQDNKIITELGKLTFGVYLIHFLIEKTLLNMGIHAYMIHPILGNILVSLIVLVLSYVFSYILSKIPIVRKITM